MRTLYVAQTQYMYIVKRVFDEIFFLLNFFLLVFRGKDREICLKQDVFLVKNVEFSVHLFKCDFRRKKSSVKQQKLALKTNFQILMKKITSFSRKYIEIFFYEIFQKNFTSFFHEIACKNCFLTNFLFSFHIPILRKFWCEICIAC